jgi:hypothetical protein
VRSSAPVNRVVDGNERIVVARRVRRSWAVVAAADLGAFDALDRLATEPALELAKHPL